MFWTYSKICIRLKPVSILRYESCAKDSAYWRSHVAVLSLYIECITVFVRIIYTKCIKWALFSAIWMPSAPSNGPLFLVIWVQSSSIMVPCCEPFQSNLRYQVRSVLIHWDAFLTIMSCYLKCFNIIRLSTPWSPSWLLPFKFCYCSFVCTSDFPPAVPLSTVSSSFLIRPPRY